MKRAILAVALLATTLGAAAKEKPKEETPYKFKIEAENPITPVKNQQRAGTCWAYCTIGMIESDLLKAGKGEHDLSEMWISRNAYMEKIEKYIRLNGYMNLDQGGNSHDIMLVVDKYGIVPEEVYKGLNYGTDVHTHGEVNAALKAYAKAIVSNPNKELSTAWRAGAEGILDAYFGAKPEKFTYRGKEYTPKSFAAELGIKGSDYVSLTSFSHHPFDSYFALEVPDNWAWGKSYNVPSEEFMSTLDYILGEGYTVSWASDVSEQGFQYRKGFAVLPATKSAEMADNEQGKWEQKSDKDIASEILSFKKVVPEIEVTDELRQKWFDNYQTTDDHGMLIYGTASEKSGAKFYLVKNSWGTEDHIYEGIFYASEPFVKGKSLNYLVNKNALPAELKAKMGIE